MDALEASHSRFGRLRLDRVEIAAGPLEFRACHPLPHLGYCVSGAFHARARGAAPETFTVGAARWSARAEDLELFFPAGGFRGLVGGLQGVAALGPGDVRHEASAPTAWLDALAGDPARAEIVRLEAWMLECHAREASATGPPAWLAELVAELEAAPHHDARRGAPRRIGRHRASVHRAFRRGLGLAPIQWLQRRRLAQAWGALEGPAPLAEVAADAGFADQSHMTRAFRRFTGRTPGALRAALRTTGAERARRSFKTAAGGSGNLSA